MFCVQVACDLGFPCKLGGQQYRSLCVCLTMMPHPLGTEDYGLRQILGHSSQLLDIGQVYVLHLHLPGRVARTRVHFLWPLGFTSLNASWEHYKEPSHRRLASHCPLPHSGSFDFPKGKRIFVGPAFFPCNLLLLCVRVHVCMEVRGHWSRLTAHQACTLREHFTHRAILPAQVCLSILPTPAGHTSLGPGTQILQCAATSQGNSLWGAEGGLSV